MQVVQLITRELIDSQTDKIPKIKGHGMSDTGDSQSMYCLISSKDRISCVKFFQFATHLLQQPTVLIYGGRVGLGSTSQTVVYLYHYCQISLALTTQWLGNLAFGKIEHHIHVRPSSHIVQQNTKLIDKIHLGNLIKAFVTYFCH